MQKKSEIFKKRNFSGQALDFLPPRKPGLYISPVDFFFFEYHEYVSVNYRKYTIFARIQLTPSEFDDPQFYFFCYLLSVLPKYDHSMNATEI